MNEFSSKLWQRLQIAVRKTPADHVVQAALALVAGTALLYLDLSRFVSAILGLPLVLVLPGYALLSVLYPDSRERDAISDPGPRSRLDFVERIAMSFATSFALFPLLGGVLFVLRGRITSDAYVVVSIVFVVSATLLALYRSRNRVGEVSSQTPYAAVANDLHASLFRTSSFSEGVVNLLLIATVCVAIGTLTYAVVNPPGGNSYASFAVLTENESGSLAASDYPTEFTEGGNDTLTVSVTNHARDTREYTVVVLVQRGLGDSRSTGDDRRVLRRMNASVSPQGTWRMRHSPDVEMDGENMRLQYLLYRGSAPTRPTAETASRELHVWLSNSSRDT